MDWSLAGLMAGLSDLRGLFPPQWFWDSPADFTVLHFHPQCVNTAMAKTSPSKEIAAKVHLTISSAVRTDAFSLSSPSLLSPAWANEFSQLSNPKFNARTCSAPGSSLQNQSMCFLLVQFLKPSPNLHPHTF